MTAIQKKIVIDEHGVPQEVIIPWAQFCELSEAMGFDLDQEAIADLCAAKRDWESGDRTAFVHLQACR